MKVSRQQAAENRTRIVAEASRLFRERGLDGVGMDALARAAGLTHGSLYSQFGSKERLAAAAIGHALAGSAAALVPDPPDAMPGDAFGAFLRRYLSRAHRDAPGGGCALPAMGAEAARHGPPVRQAMTAGVRAMARRLADLLPWGSDRAGEDRALAVLATLTGALVLARAVDDPDLSDRILAATRTHLADLA